MNKGLDDRARGSFLTGGKLLARNTLINLAGVLVPILVALIALPALIRGLGTARFGILALAWMVIGYSSVFDLGLGRALTKIVAEKLGRSEETDIPGLVWTAQALMILLGATAGLILSLLAPQIIHLFKIPTELRGEALHTVYILAVCLPIVISTAGLRGILEARQRFDLSSTIWAIVGISNFLGPLIILPFSKTLTSVVAVITIFRFLAWIIHIRLCISVFPALVHYRVVREAIRPLFALGGWMTVSNLLNPLLGSSDRFMIAAIVSVTAVAYYATPYEIMTRILVIPGALTGVLFPAFSTSSAGDREHTCVLFAWATKIVYLCMFPLILVFVMFGGYGLQLWLGPDFAAKSTHILQLFAVNVFLSSVALVAFALIQAAGRPDITAKINLLELLVYLPFAWLLIHARGIEGAAWAWFARIAVDTVILFFVVRRLFPGTSALVRRMGILLGVTVSFFLLLTVIHMMPGYLALLVIFMTLFAIVGWLFVLVPGERVQLRKYLVERDWTRLAPSFLR